MTDSRFQDAWSRTHREADWRDLTGGEIEDFRRDGAICLRGLYSQPWLQLLADELDAIAEAEAGTSGPSIKGGYYEWMKRDPIRDFVLFGPTAKPVRQALGSSRLNFFYDQVFIKEGLQSAPTPWHHDYTFWPIAGTQIASVWAALEPVNAEGSALEFVAGSHLWERQFKAISVTGADVSSRPLEDVPDIEADRDAYRILSWELEPGDALLFHALTLHGARGNTAARRRRAITTRWTGDDALYNEAGALPRFLWNPHLKDGDPLSGRLFPQVLPTLIDAEIEERMRAPIPPDPEQVAAILAARKHAELQSAQKSGL